MQNDQTFWTACCQTFKRWFTTPEQLKKKIHEHINENIDEVQPERNYIAEGIQWCKNNKKKLFAIGVGIVAIGAVMYKSREHQTDMSEQGKTYGSTNHRSAAKGSNSNKGRVHHKQRSGKGTNKQNPWDMSEGPVEHFDEDLFFPGSHNYPMSDSIHNKKYKLRDVVNDEWNYKYAMGQEEAWTQAHNKFWNIEEIPKDVKNISELQRKIKKSKHDVKVNTQDYLNWLQTARAQKDEAVTKMKETKLKGQAYNPDDISAGIYKIYDDQNRYLCTGTLASNRMFVVLHCLDSNDLTRNYRAVNHVHSIELKANTLETHNDEIGSFAVNGIKSPFTIGRLRVMNQSEIVSVFGYGDGLKTRPEIIMGFASPLGWCTAATRNGDCTSPVLDVDGRIVGFWTHGNGINFGKFEPVTPSMLEQLRGYNGQQENHVGLDFQSILHTPKSS